MENKGNELFGDDKRKLFYTFAARTSYMHASVQCEYGNW